MMVFYKPRPQPSFHCGKQRGWALSFLLDTTWPGSALHSLSFFQKRYTVLSHLSLFILAGPKFSIASFKIHFESPKDALSLCAQHSVTPRRHRVLQRPTECQWFKCRRRWSDFPPDSHELILVRVILGKFLNTTCGLLWGRELKSFAVDVSKLGFLALKGGETKLLKSRATHLLTLASFADRSRWVGDAGNRQGIPTITYCPWCRILFRV
jgi:hypothetical protein